MIQRNLHQKVREYQKVFPVVAIIGPRQCGKTTLADMLSPKNEPYLFLDLERDADINKLNDPELFFHHNSDQVICIDEIQRLPELFRSMRPVIDKDRRRGRFLILGSASGALLNQSSESLAGRIGYLELTPFTQSELLGSRSYDQETHWMKGGYPDSYLQKDAQKSWIWRENFIRTFVERDIGLLESKLSIPLTRRLLSMCAHLNGQLVNFSEISRSLGVNYQTVQRYLEVLEQMFLLRRLPPYFFNTKKRLVKAPRFYFRDTGLLHTLLGVHHMNELLGHPGIGASWESYCLENIMAHFTDWQAYFYRTSSGNEIDLILEKGNEKMAIEFKASTSPGVSKGLNISLDELGIDKAWVIAQVEGSYPLSARIMVSSLEGFISTTP